MSAPASERTPTKEPEDVTLVQRAARGDRLALASLYDLHAPVLTGLARQILGTHGDAEDLVHDVFLEAWRHSNEYDPRRGSVRAWLALRTRSRAIDVLRSARVGRTVGASSEEMQNRPDPASAEVELAPDRSALHAVLARLPEEQRHVLVLGYFRGMSSSEIADHLGIPVGTVKSRVLAALTKLREAYAATSKEGRS